MRRALVLTAYNRVDYLRQTLDSWRSVRGLDRWHIDFSIEPSDVEDEIKAEIESFIKDTGHKDTVYAVNTQRYGVLLHPWMCFERLFYDGYDFVVRAEDDLVVSEDILEYFEWGSEHGGGSTIAVLGYTDEDGADNGVRLSPSFCPWVWGTWNYAWAKVIGPTWDKDYSTFNGYPGNQCLPTRTQILTRRGWLSHDEVRVGDETIGFNPSTGLSEWTIVTHVVSPFEAETVTLFSATKQVEATRNHHWLTQLVSSRTGKKRLVMRTTEELTAQNYVVQSVLADTGSGMGITLDEAALLGWIAGDGTVVSGPGSKLKVSVSQKKTEWFASIEQAFSGSEHSVYDYGDVRTWCLSTGAARELLARAGHPKKDAVEQVLSMSSEQRSRWLEAVDQAEGTDHGSKRRIYQCAGPVAEAIQIAIYLEGYRPSRSALVEKEGWTPYYAQSYGVPRARAGVPHSSRMQDVWCVTTGLGTWTARQDDRVFLTGNSGWDWNLNTRIFPRFGLQSLVPTSSRVGNIGITGVHGTAENFRTSPSFIQHRPPAAFTLV